MPLCVSLSLCVCLSLSLCCVGGSVDWLRFDSNALEDAGLTPQRLQQLTTQFHTHKEALRATLAATGIALPRVVDLTWRLDYTIKSDVLEKMDTPVYLLNLHSTSYIRRLCGGKRLGPGGGGRGIGWLGCEYRCVWGERYHAVERGDSPMKSFLLRVNSRATGRCGEAAAVCLLRRTVARAGAVAP